jgi:hypothetical protein
MYIIKYDEYFQLMKIGKNMLGLLSFIIKNRMNPRRRTTNDQLR